MTGTSRIALISIALLHAACGDGGGGSTPDSGPPDSGPPDSPQPGTVQVQVFASDYASEALPLDGILVAFNAPDGSLVGTALTDELGRARRDDVPPGSSLTFNRQAVNEPGPHLVTVAGLEPGDRVRIGGGSVFSFGDTVGSLQVNFADNGADAYRLSMGGTAFTTASGATQATAGVQECCSGPGPKTDYLLLALDDMEKPTHQASAIDVPVILGNTAVHAAPAWVATAPRTITFASPPADSVSYVGMSALRRSRTYYYAGAEGLSLATAALDFADEYEVRYNGSFPDGGGVSLAQRGSSLDESPRDLTSLLLPRIFVGAIDFANAQRPAITITAGGSLASADGGQIYVRWNSGNGRWFVVVPPAENIAFTTPELPAELAAALPPVAATIAIFASFVRSDGVDGYRDLVNNGDVLDLYCSGMFTACARTTNDDD